ncbi:MAG: hypothetical protein H6626_05660 [Pseudobdellovibrionaceae bacterium]|nr:MAG: hypothetical protein H6626_05660 [Pseudobdellovibrionaceae bacterium]
MREQRSTKLPELRRQLIFQFGSLWQASQHYNLSYDRLVNIVAGRTQISEEEIQQFATTLGLGEGWPNSENTTEEGGSCA